jgi:peptidoglycan/LPS O-acetylase OafA/YrhL
MTGHGKPLVVQLQVQTIVPIQVLRALAALIVVIGHIALHMPRAHNNDAAVYLAVGGTGVDLFFVISGFVMVYSSERLFGSAHGALTFFTRRVIRIIPIYWLLTTLYVVLEAAAPNLNKGYSAEYIASSYLFFPHARPDGTMQPVLAQGWTLDYEMLFYLLFASTVFWPRRIVVAACSLVLVAIVIAGKLLAPLPPVPTFWTDAIMLEFVFGMLLGFAYYEGARMPQWLAAVLLVAGFAGLCLVWPLLNAAGGQRALATGIPAAFVVGAATLGNFSLTGWFWRLPVMVGNASYALYLTHGLVVPATFVLFRATNLDQGDAAWLVFPAATIASVLVAIAAYHGFERPMTSTLRRRASAFRLFRPAAVTAKEERPRL